MFLCRTNSPTLTTLRVGGSGILLRSVPFASCVSGYTLILGSGYDMQYITLAASLGFPAGSDSEESFCDARDLGFDPSVGEDALEKPSPGEGDPPASWQENAVDRSLVGYGPRGLKCLAPLSD